MNESIIFQSSVVRTERGLTIRGTRITLYQIIDYLKAGKSAKMIRDDLRLTIQQTADVLEYIDMHKEEVETEYQQVMRDTEAERSYWEERNRERLAQIAQLPPKTGQEKIRSKLQAIKKQLGY